MSSRSIGSAICVQLLILVVFCSPYGWAVTNVATVDEILDRASRSLQEKNYRGRLTYEFGGALDTLEIIHANRDGIEYERLEHLNGPRREVVRRGHSVKCVTTGGFLMRGGLISAGGGAVSLAQNYHFYLRGDERIAGRDALILQIAPRDPYRYGLTLAVDKASGLPLMLLTTNPEQKVLERFQFVNLEVDGEIEDGDLEAVYQDHLALGPEDVACVRAPVSMATWQAGWLPEGFVLSQFETTKGNGESLTYTDGIGSFSVFVKPSDPKQPSKVGVAQRGATLVLLSGLSLPERGEVDVVVVGEVPSATAQKVAASIQPVQGVETQQFESPRREQRRSEE